MLKNNRGFTLVEMLIVMLIITVLMLLIIPNIISQSDNVNDKGCEALISVVQAQTDAYYLAENEYPDLATLKSEGYIEESQKKCNQQVLQIKQGKVSITPPSNED